MLLLPIGDSSEIKIRPNLRARAQSVKVAEEVAKELLWRHMKERPGFDKMLKESVISSQNGMWQYMYIYMLC